MKKLLAVIMAVFAAATCMAQDVIIKRNGDEIKSKVLELTPGEVRYKRYDNPEGPVYTIFKNEVFMIRYENGIKEVINEQAINKEAMPQDVSRLGEQAPYQIRLNGPRLGLTVVGPGELADKLDERGVAQVISQFGWQFETRIFTTERGTSGLIELVPLVGGLEQGTFLPSISGIVGLRNGSG
ncbi:MAG: hypothetical protein LPK19_07585, partial [Hymenobacteraceae bacterium]|nr:hypothetical protein [Hymenobacteraceae bacterium]MDX5396071.1 hypothetical protein [Hymenobacteraceae bacterium]MDX5512134.1 hypothetical protein [Hymenobacteraceae bacterium]